jgi:hypothetical protein
MLTTKQLPRGGRDAVEGYPESIEKHAGFVYIQEGRLQRQDSRIVWCSLVEKCVKVATAIEAARKKRGELIGEALAAEGLAGEPAKWPEH